MIAIVVMLTGVRALSRSGFLRAELPRATAPDTRTIINLERVELGRYIMAGLELFIVSDTIHTALEPRLPEPLLSRDPRPDPLGDQLFPRPGDGRTPEGGRMRAAFDDMRLGGSGARDPRCAFSLRGDRDD
jgi:hypothetical protein